MRRIAVIPARGGSKRLPRKNILPFLGKPMIAYSIEAAMQTGLFERIIVSTEDEEIAVVGRQFGAVVDARTLSLATDASRVSEVCVDLLQRERAASREYDVMCVLYPTAPLRSAKDISSVVNLVDLRDCQCAMAVTDYSHPPHQALRLAADGYVQPMWPELVNCRDEEIGVLCVDNGSTYAVGVQYFLQARTFYGARLRVHRMPLSHSVDINTATDFELARHYASSLS